MANSTEIIQAGKLSKSFGTTQAVKDVSLSLKEGEILGLLGPNGARKTTTIRMILDIFQFDGGGRSARHRR